MVEIIKEDYKTFLAEVKERIRKAQYEALKAVNKELIFLYWDIGKMIVERQKKYNWGNSIVQNLAMDLQKEFPGMSGLSPSNLWRMRNFFIAYANNKKLAPLVREISWSHNIIILEKCKDNLEREFYIRMTRKFGWSKNILAHQIENKTYKKTLLGQTSFEKTLPEKLKHQTKLTVKDEYIFGFLELSEEHSEMELERAILAKMNKFLIEMNAMFAFLGNQYRIEINGKEYFIDMLLYHRHLKCLVAIELKVSEFRPEYVGKMQFYLSVLDDKVKFPDENPSIGIIICKEKNRIIVEYALRDTSKPIGVATYKITSKLPKNLKKQLPSPEQIQKLIDKI